VVVDDGYERMGSWCASRSLQEGGVFVDVGASVGHYSILCGKIVGSKGVGLAVEPDLVSMFVLRDSIARVGLSHVNPIQCAVSDKPGSFWFHLNGGDNLGDHRLWLEDGEKRDYLLVPGLTLDMLCKDMTSVDFLKVDTQGWEMRVLCGGIDVIKRSPNLSMLVEFYPYGLVKSGTTCKDFMSFLYGMGFHIYMVDEDNGRMLGLSEGVIMEPSHPEINRQCVNLYCTKQRMGGICDHMTKPDVVPIDNYQVSGYTDVWLPK